MSDYIVARAASGTWAVRTADAVIGESRDVVELSEGELAPVIYFPRTDIATAFLEPSETMTHCPHKGDATYYHIETESGRVRDAAWSYLAPREGVAEIAGRIAFNPALVTVERI